MAKRIARSSMRRPLSKAVDYSPELADAVLKGLVDGQPLIMACQDNGLPDTASVHRWVSEDCDGVAARFRAALQMRCVAFARQAADIADMALNDLKMDGAGPDKAVAPPRWQLACSLELIYDRAVMMAAILP
jgi:hypothetical protein